MAGSLHADEDIGSIYASGDCEIDLRRRELRVLGSPTPVGGRAFEFIEVLARSAGELVTKDELMDRIWPGAAVLENTIQVHAASVRKALGPYRNLLKTVSGRGYRLLGNWTVRRHDAAHPPVGLQQMQADGESPVSNFPLTVTQLIGRSAAVARVRDLVTAYRAVTLTGPGGIGKTALALKVTRGVLGEFTDGGWLVDLAPLSEPSLVLSAVAQALGLNPRDGDLSAEAIARDVDDRHLLLVLDDCEHVIETVALMAETFMRLCPRMTILATSQEVLRIEGEHVFRVPPLEVPSDDQRDPDQILTCGAVELFLTRTKALGAAVSVEHDLPAIGAICRRLDGIPLAVEFAAARAATLGVELVAAGLNDRFALLTNGRRTAAARHQTLRATLDWSYGLLSSKEQELLRRLAIFPTGFTLEDAEAISIADRETESVVEMVSGLVARSLLDRVDSASVARWRLSETTRAFALDELRRRNEYATAARRHAEYMIDRISLPRRGTATMSNSVNAALRVHGLDNVRAALDWCFSPNGDRDLGAALTVAAVPVLMWLASAG